MLAVQMAVVHTLFVSSNRFALSRFMELSSPSIRYRPISAILVAADSTARFFTHRRNSNSNSSDTPGLGSPARVLRLFGGPLSRSQLTTFHFRLQSRFTLDNVQFGTCL